MEKKAKKTFWAVLSNILSTEAVESVLVDFLISTLKLQAMGGIRGMILKRLVKEFSDEVITVTKDTLDYVDISVRADSTINMDDRDEATDTLNDILN